MDLFHNLWLGITVAGDPDQSLLFCFIGALLGTLIGVLPGIGPLATVAMLLPVTFYLEPVTALVMLAGIYYGAQYGGSTTSILVNLPGESSSVVTCLDGYQMARQGRAGSALAVAALGSLFAGCVATLVIALFSARSPATLAQEFRPADYCALMVFGLVAAVILASGSAIKAIAHGDARPAARHYRHRRQFGPGRATPWASTTSPTASASSASPWACSASARSSRTSSSAKPTAP